MLLPNGRYKLGLVLMAGISNLPRGKCLKIFHQYCMCTNPVYVGTIKFAFVYTLYCEAQTFKLSCSLSHVLNVLHCISSSFEIHRHN